LKCRLNDPRISSGEIVAALADSGDLLAIALDSQAVSVVLDLVDPAMVGGTFMSSTAKKTYTLYS
jgi:hypothetical protein